MAKRGERVAPPARPGTWEVRHATGDAAEGWEHLCQQAPGPTRDCFDALTRAPRDRSNPGRQHPLKGLLETRDVKGKKLEQWQYEVTGAGRVWYCVDDEERRVWVTAASVGHPKETES